VGRVTIGKKKYAEVESQMKQMVQQAEELRSALKKAVVDDAASFEQVLQALKLPKETPEQQSLRGHELEKATINAAKVPFQTAELCLRVLQLSQAAITHGNLNAVSDALSSAHLANAALRCAAANVRINANSLKDPSILRELLDHTAVMLQKGEDLESAILNRYYERSGLAK